MKTALQLVQNDLNQQLKSLQDALDKIYNNK